ncbi:hypothetical protein [Streptomyces phaeochromogenes]|uniref:hypothetical protein n=1 Tax=Streptomyces phaeochromogenes TaxID=1923 RepID=UPI00386690B5|nr:hypothetical protein OHB08_23175 [Streptomyces phaeochromogenes]
MAVVGFLPTIYRDGGMAGVWPGVLSAVVGAANAIGSITTAALMKRGLPARALLVPAFALMATTSLPAFAVDWQTLPAGTAWQFLCVVAFSLTGGAIPATLLRLIGELTPTGGSAPRHHGPDPAALQHRQLRRSRPCRVAGHPHRRLALHLVDDLCVCGSWRRPQPPPQVPGHGSGGGHSHSGGPGPGGRPDDHPHRGRHH